MRPTKTTAVGMRLRRTPYSTMSALGAHGIPVPALGPRTFYAVYVRICKERVLIVELARNEEPDGAALTLAPFPQVPNSDYRHKNLIYAELCLP
jgi:hypothetical protein